MRDIIPIFIPHLGCPHDCIFCNQRKIAGTVDAPTTNQVFNIIKAALEKKRSVKPQVAFYGGSFTAIPIDEQNAYLDVVNQFIADGTVSSLRISTRPDCIDKDTLKRLKSQNVKTIEIGAQSMSDVVLNAAGRGHNAHDTQVASKDIIGYGFELILQIMVGLPLDSLETARETARKICELKPFGVRIYPVAVIKNTGLEKLWRKGEYTHLEVDEAAEICASLLSIFNEHGIHVIRIGLNPTEELSGGDVLAGAYHPAFGELTRSKIYLKNARDILKSMGDLTGRHVTIYVNTSRISVMTGQKGINRKLILEEFSLSKLDIRGKDIPELEIKIEI